MSNLVCSVRRLFYSIKPLAAREKTNGPLKVKNDSSGGREVFMLYWHEAIAKLNREEAAMFTLKSQRISRAPTPSVCALFTNTKLDSLSH